MFKLNSNKQLVQPLFILFFLTLKFNFAQAQPDIIVEELPYYIGGNEQLQTDLNRYLLYPEKARTRNIQGTVLVEFEVDTNGSVLNSTVVEGIIPEMDSAAVTVINFLNNWKPGRQNGKAVKMKVTLPVRFSLYSNSNTVNENQTIKEINKYHAKVIELLSKDNLGELTKLIDTIPAALNPEYYAVFRFREIVSLYLICKNYDKAAQEIIRLQNETNRKIYSTESDLHKALDIYLNKNYGIIAQHLDQSDIAIDTKNVLKLFLAIDYLLRNPDQKNLNYFDDAAYDKSYAEKRSKLGYNYLKFAIDTSYNPFVRKYIVVEKRFKNFAWGIGMGYGKIIQHTANRKVYSNPDFFTTNFDFLYKDWYLTITSNLGGSTNYQKISIDTFNLKPYSKLGNTYILFGLGHRFYLGDLVHIVPYFAYNVFEVSYQHKLTEEKSITKSKNLETNFTAGFAMNFYFTKNRWENFKPANYNPLGLTFKYGLLAPNKNFEMKQFAHFFSLNFTLLFMAPKEYNRAQNYFMYR